MKKYPDILKKGIYMDGNLGMFWLVVFQYLWVFYFGTCEWF